MEDVAPLLKRFLSDEQELFERRATPAERAAYQQREGVRTRVGELLRAHKFDTKLLASACAAEPDVQKLVRELDRARRSLLPRGRSKKQPGQGLEKVGKAASPPGAEDAPSTAKKKHGRPKATREERWSNSLTAEVKRHAATPGRNSPLSAKANLFKLMQGGAPGSGKGK